MKRPWRRLDVTGTFLARTDRTAPFRCVPCGGYLFSILGCKAHEKRLSSGQKGGQRGRIVLSAVQVVFPIVKRSFEPLTQRNTTAR